MGMKWNEVSIAQSCLTLQPHGLVHGIFQARILEWVAFPFSRGSSQARDQTQVSHIVRIFFTSWATREAEEYWIGQPIPSSADLPDPGIEPVSPALQMDSLPTELSGKPNIGIILLKKFTLKNKNIFEVFCTVPGTSVFKMAPWKSENLDSHWTQTLTKCITLEKALNLWASVSIYVISG